MPKSDKKTEASRREFLKETAGGLLGTALVGANVVGIGDAATQNNAARTSGQASVTLTAVAALPSNLTRIWLGESFWANRLQDWRLHAGRIECTTGGEKDAVRTASLLTREIVRGDAVCSVSARVTLIEDSGAGGFGGFLIGAGAGRLDYRAAALVQGLSGEGGGLMCVYGADGRLSFREHTNEAKPSLYAELEAKTATPNGAISVTPARRDVVLRLDIAPHERGTFDLKLSASDVQSGAMLAGITRRNVADAELIGGIALVSSTAVAQNTNATASLPTSNAVSTGDASANKAGARFAFADIRTGGTKIALRPEQATGPILGALYSLNGKVLKLSAQMMPLGDTESRTARLQIRPSNAKSSTGDLAWRDAQSADIKGGYSALFRLDDWDATRDWDYRVVYESGTPGAQTAYYAGVIRRDPVEKESLTIGMLGCIIAAYHRFDAGIIRKEVPQAAFLGRFTPQNIYFPHTELSTHASSHQPDLLVFSGDQLYETSPTRIENRVSPTLDYLYKWYLWVWAFRDMTRNTPTILQTDDHDVYHPNVWGNGGRHAPENDWNKGGYLPDADWVNMVQRTQCGHNPDPFDPTPADQGITVYYGAFRYGGVSFAVLEDRKFKTAPIQGEDLDVHEPELLGARQEKFLTEWAKDNTPAKIVLTQTLWGCLQTSPRGRAMVDFDSNGYPK